MRGLIFTLVLTVPLWAQFPTDYRLGKIAIDSTASYMLDTSSVAGLASNSIVDIYPAGDSLLFFGTARGLSITPDLGQTFRSYVTEGFSLPRGAISALSSDDSLIMIAGLSDSTINGTAELFGTGLAFSEDAGDTWTGLPVPKEASGDNLPEDTSFVWGTNTIEQLAIRTIVNNITWDLAYSMGTIWLASWSSGLRRYNTTTGVWSVVPMPRDIDQTFSCDSIPDGYKINPRDPSDGGQHNHKGFSVIAFDSTVWVGTANGINKGIVDASNGCIAWNHYTSQNDNITGNWVVALHRQTWDSNERIWASTVQTDSPGEVQGLSYTDDGGTIWKTTLVGTRVHNISSSGSTVYAATEDGLYKSLDGISWALFSSAVDAVTGERVYANAATGVFLDDRDSTLWVGTPDGLARTTDAGENWQLERSFQSTQTADVRFYGYPNPFSPSTDNILDGSGYVRFQYHIATGETGSPATIAIFDFAMDPVIELETRTHGSVGDFSQAWDGRNAAGYAVANGVYYCRLKIGLEKYWTKVVVIN